MPEWVWIYVMQRNILTTTISLQIKHLNLRRSWQVRNWMSLNAKYIEANAQAFNAKGYTADVSTVIQDPGNLASLLDVEILP